MRGKKTHELLAVTFGFSLALLQDLSQHLFLVILSSASLPRSRLWLVTTTRPW